MLIRSNPLTTHEVNLDNKKPKFSLTIVDWLTLTTTWLSSFSRPAFAPGSRYFDGGFIFYRLRRNSKPTAGRTLLHVRKSASGVTQETVIARDDNPALTERP
jgi:hypothetical protein